MAMMAHPRKKGLKVSPLLAVLLISLAARLLFMFSYHEIWWDSSVYVAMGKYMFSAGQSGLWEHIRPPLWPFLLGFFWKIGISPVAAGRLMELLFSLGSIALSYLIAEQIFDRRTAYLSAIILSFSSIFFFFTFRLYTEMPSVFLVLLGFYLYIRGRPALAGLSIGFAFLFKFPAGIFVLPVLFMDLRKWRRSSIFLLSFMFPVSLLLISNYIMYGSALMPLLFASAVIKKVVGCNVLHRKEWYYYFDIIARDNIFNIFSLAGIYSSMKRISRERLLLLLFFLFPFIYFLQLPCRDYRYIILFLPFVSMFTAHGIMFISSVLSSRLNILHSYKAQSRYFLLLSLAVLAVSASFSISYCLSNEPSSPNWSEEFFSYPLELQDTSLIAVTNPKVTLYTDAKLYPVYYPLYNSTRIRDFIKIISSSKPDKPPFDLVMLDTCNGGMSCPPSDDACKYETSHLISLLNSSMTLKYYKSAGPCTYFIFS